MDEKLDSVNMGVKSTKQVKYGVKNGILGFQ